MEKLTQYREYTKQIIQKYAQFRLSYGQVEMQTIFDETRDHYQLMAVGWDGSSREYGIILHVDLKDGKIWIQHDGTERGIANDFVDLGVPKSDIVLGFHAPYKRPYTGFATGDEAA